MSYRKPDSMAESDSMNTVERAILEGVYGLHGAPTEDVLREVCRVLKSHTYDQIRVRVNEKAFLNGDEFDFSSGLRSAPRRMVENCRSRETRSPHCSTRPCFVIGECKNYERSCHHHLRRPISVEIPPSIRG